MLNCPRLLGLCDEVACLRRVPKIGKLQGPKKLSICVKILVKILIFWVFVGSPLSGVCLFVWMCVCARARVSVCLCVCVSRPVCAMRQALKVVYYP